MTEVKQISSELLNDNFIDQLHEAFPVSDDNQDWNLEKTRSLVVNAGNIFLVGYIDDQMAGFLYGHALDRFDAKKKFFIYELGTNQAFRRQGVMKEIISFLLNLLKQKGFDSAWVLTEKQNTPAMNLYSSTGGEINEDEIMFNYPLNERSI